MLDALRKGASTWVAKVLIALLVFSFAIWGVSDMFRGLGQNMAARVGDREVSIYAFDRAFRQDLNRFGQQFGRPLTAAEGAQFGVPQQTLGRLVAEAALNNTADGMKISLSDERLATIIQSDPAFQGIGGRFDRSRLNQVLQANAYTEDEYVMDRRSFAERQQITQAIAGGMPAPEAFLKLLNDYQRETRDISYLLIEAEPAETLDDPDSSTLDTYFAGNIGNFRAPEYREITYVTLSPEALARPENIVEDDARAEYERRLDQFLQDERRHVRQLTFSSLEEAQAAAARVSGGTATFDDLVVERGLSDTDVDLGLKTRSEFLDDAIGDAVFALGAGETSAAVDGRFSIVVLNVTEVQEQSTKPFEDVRDEIVLDLAQADAEQEILDLYDEIEDARAGGALLSEVAGRFSLAVEAPAAFDASGNAADGQPVELPDVSELVGGAFQSDIGIENDPLQFGERGFLWYEVAKVIPSRERELDEVRGDVIAAWKQEEAVRRLDERAQTLLARAENAVSLDGIAEAEGLEVKTVSKLTRTAPSSDIGAAAANAAFAGPVGLTATAPANSGTGRVVLKVTSSALPDFDGQSTEIAALGTQFSTQLQQSLLSQYITAEEDSAGIEINQAAIAQILGLNTTH